MRRETPALAAILLLAAAAVAGCSDGDGAPDNHREDLGGVMHAAGFEEPRLNCIACHGIDLQGGEGPGCFGCHGSGSF